MHEPARVESAKHSPARLKCLEAAPKSLTGPLVTVASADRVPLCVDTPEQQAASAQAAKLAVRAETGNTHSQTENAQVHRFARCADW